MREFKASRIILNFALIQYCAFRLTIAQNFDEVFVILRYSIRCFILHHIFLIKISKFHEIYFSHIYYYCQNLSREENFGVFLKSQDLRHL